jgi:hypothetical protein
MSTPFPIQGLKPIAAGSFRLVYQHPESPNLLIKVIRPEMVGQEWGNGAPWYKRRRRMKQHSLFLRETTEYLATYAAEGKAPWFAQKISGRIETDLGLVVEVARDREGRLAPTMSSSCRRQVRSRRANLISKRKGVTKLFRTVDRYT